MRRNRSNLILGILLILVGVWLAATQQVPLIRDWLENNFSWPMWVIGSGFFLLLFGLIVGAPGMAVPATIVAGVGGILYYQYSTDNYTAWYLWLLVPGFVGVGVMLAGLLGENTRHNLAHGFNLVIISGLLFMIFASVYGEIAILNGYGPAVILIALGVYILVRRLIFSGYRGHDETQ